MQSGETDLDSMRHRPDYLSLNSQNDVGEFSEALDMLPAQVHSLEALEARRDAAADDDDGSASSQSNSMHLRMPGVSSTAELALAALQYLPTPLIVLSSFKTIVMSNEAMGRLLTLTDDERDHHISPTQLLAGKSLAQIGVSMLQDGTLLWVTWDQFLDQLEHDQSLAGGSKNSDLDGGDITPTAEKAHPMAQGPPSADTTRTMVHDSVVEVVIATEQALVSVLAQRGIESSDVKHIYAKMIITIWELDGQKFYSLTFISSEPGASSLPSSRVQSRTVSKAYCYNTPIRGPATTNSSFSSPSSAISGQSNRGSSSSLQSSLHASLSPTSSLSHCSFPPPGPPSQSVKSQSPSALQKIILMKDALLDNTDIPILAMWKDESLTVPNRAARRLFHPSADTLKVDGFELVTKWKVWNEHFTEEL